MSIGVLPYVCSLVFVNLLYFSEGTTDDFDGPLEGSRRVGVAAALRLHSRLGPQLRSAALTPRAALGRQPPTLGPQLAQALGPSNE